MQNLLARKKKIQLLSFIVPLTAVLQAPIIQVIFRSRVNSTTERTCGGEMEVPAVSLCNLARILKEKKTQRFYEDWMKPTCPTYV